MGDAQNTAKEEYKGPGKFNSVVGRASTESFVLGLIGTAIGALIGKGFWTRRAAIGSGLGAAIGVLHGGYKGYEAAAAAKSQVDDLNSQVTALTGKLEEEKRFTKLVMDRRENTPATPGQSVRR